VNMANTLARHGCFFTALSGALGACGALRHLIIHEGCFHP
jgi:hypothetical protein